MSTPCALVAIEFFMRFRSFLVLDDFDFSNSIQLRSLELGPINHASIPVLLERQSFPRLQVITFSLWSDWVQLLRPLDNAALEASLDNPSMGSLQEVRFLYSGPFKVDIVDARVRRRFPTLCARLCVRVMKVGDTWLPY